MDRLQDAAAILADAANGIAMAREYRGIVRRLEPLRERWEAFAATVRALATKPAEPPSPRAPLPPTAGESSLEFWETRLRELSREASASGFHVTYDVWPAPAKGSDDATT
jgi:hypothetical protein